MAAAYGALQPSWRWDFQADLIHTSAGFASTLGDAAADGAYAPDDLFARVHDKDRADLAMRMRAHAATGEGALEVTFCVPTQARGDVHFLLRAMAIRSEACVPSQLICVLVDITMSHTQTERLLAHQDRVTAMLQQTGAAFFEFDRDLVCIHYSHPGDGLLGARNEQALGRSVTDMLPDAVAVQVLRDVADGRCGPVENLDMPLVHKDGSTRWLRWSVYPLTRDGVTNGCRLIVLDVSDQKDSERALAESQKRFADAMSFSGECVYELDQSGRFVFASSAALDVFGVRAEALIGRNVFDFLVGEVPDGEASWSAYTDKVGVWNEREALLRDDSGDRRWVSFSGRVLRDSTGKMQGVRGVARNQTSQRMAQRRLEESEKRFAALADLSGECVVEVDSQGRYTFASAAAKAVFGVEPEALIGLSPVDLLAEPIGLSPHAWAQSLAGRQSSWTGAEHLARTPDGKLRWLRSNAEVIKAADGSIKGVRASIQDVTAARQTAEAMATNDARLRALAQFTGWVWYDLDLDFNVTYISENAGEVVGLAPETILGKPMWAFIDLPREIAEPLVRSMLTQGECVLDTEAPYRFFADGPRRWFRVHARPIRDADGKVVGYRGASTDITQARQAQQQIKLSESRLRTLAQSTGWLWFDLDARFRVKFASENSEAITGHTPGALVGRDMWDFIALDRATYETPMLEALHGPDGKIETEAPYQFAPGRPEQWLKVHTRVLRDASGAIIGYRGACTDVTAAREAAAAIAWSEERLRDIAEFSGWVWFELDTDLRYRFVSPNAPQVVGYQVDEVLGRSLGCMQAVADEEIERIARRRIARDGAIRNMEVLHAAHGDKPALWFRVSLRPIRDPAGLIIGYRGVAFDIDAQKRAELNLQASEKRFGDVVETLGEMIFELDADRRFTYVAPQYAREYGFKTENLIGRSPPILERASGSIDPETMRVRVDEGRSGAFEGRFIDGHGRERWVRVTMRARYDSAGKIAGYLGSSSDITHRKAQEEALEAAMHAAEAAARAKADFLATMSHEIRTPLNAVIGMSELLLDTPLSPRQRGFAASANTAGRHLLALVNDILDVSKLDAGKLDLEDLPMELAQETEAARLRQILVNFIGNAVKFTAQGSVSLTVTRTDAGAIRFTVRDTGVGIAPDVLAGLFQDFAQGGAQVSRTHGGTGLGLAISRRLAQLMGGEVGVESELGVGSTFWAEIPLKPAAAPMADQADGPALRASLKVLVAEDNKANQMLVRALLDRMGCIVTMVENGALAVEAARSAVFDVVLMDMQMPVMDGEEATRAIRALPERRTLPIIALTADVSTDTRTRLMAAGMSDYLTKPIDAKRLAHTIAQWTQAPSVPHSPETARSA
jgi:PAS domain S-box-containing protein